MAERSKACELLYGFFKLQHSNMDCPLHALGLEYDRHDPACSSRNETWCICWLVPYTRCWMPHAGKTSHAVHYAYLALCIVFVHSNPVAHRHQPTCKHSAGSAQAAPNIECVHQDASAQPAPLSLRIGQSQAGCLRGVCCTQQKVHLWQGAPASSRVAKRPKWRASPCQ